MAIRIAILLLIYMCPLVGQQYNFKKYGVGEGVALSQIGPLNTLSNGKLIVTTIGGGLNIYDGQNFNLFNSTNGLANNNIYCMLKESDTRIWFGTEKGLSLFNGSTFTNYSLKDGLPSATIWGLAKDKDNNVWIGTDNGLAKYKNGKFEIIENKLVKSKAVWSLYCDSKDNLWLSLFDGTEKCHLFNGKITQSKSFSEIKNVNVFLEDEHSNLWAGTDDGLIKISENNISLFTEKDGLTSNIIYSLFLDSKKRLWVGTEEGVSLFTNNEISKLGEKQGLTDYKIWSIKEDLENNIWIGSDEGLFKMSDMSFRIYKEFNGRPIDVWRIIEKNKNDYWLLSELQGIVDFKDGNFSQIKIGSFRQRGLSAFFVDRDENIWLTSEKGIFKYSKSNYNRPITSYTDIYSNIYAITQRENGNILFGTFYEGTIEYDGKSFNSPKIIPNENSTINNYLIDSQKRTWAATGDGLRIINEDSTYTPEGFEIFNNYSFMTLVEDNYGKIWAGSYEAGLFSFDSKNIDVATFDTVSVEHGLNNTAIMATTFDANGNLWISTNAGLNKLDINEYHKTGKKKILAYGRHDGIPGVEGYQNGIYRDSENNILFSTIDGLVVFDPENIQQNKRPPNVEIKSIKVVDKEFNEMVFSKNQIDHFEENTITMTYDNNNLTIDFVGISLTNPTNVKYSYQLNDNEWSEASPKSSVYLPNLTYGEYSLRMKACNNNGVWSEQFASINIEITAPFWRIIWVQLVAVALIIGLMFLFYLFRINRMNNINIDLEERIKERIKYEAQLKKSESELRFAKEEAEKSDKLKTEFLAQMSHEIRTPINSILSYTSLLKESFKDNLEESDSSGFNVIENSSHRLIRTIDSILNLSQLQTESLDLNKKQNNICAIIKDLHGEFNGIADSKNLKLELDIFANECFVRVDQYTFTQMLANLIDNAIKYTNKGRVVVSLKESDEEKILLEVSDTGIGMTDEFKEKLFQPFTQEEQGYTRKYDGAGLGLSLVKKYADINKVKLSFTSSKNIGTTFSIEIDS